MNGTWLHVIIGLNWLLAWWQWESGSTFIFVIEVLCPICVVWLTYIQKEQSLTSIYTKKIKKDIRDKEKENNEGVQREEKEASTIDG